jgi:ubiquinone/menaquinone biosynthesis C-methylase UbiE
MTHNARSTEVESVKTRLKAMWMAGDYDRFSRYMESNAREFYERLDVAPGCQFLDVGCGSGRLALIAAKEGIQVTGVDIASNLLERARVLAQAEGLTVRFEEADAEALPFEDANFDVVASLIGAMFAPRPELVAKELLRVCVPGGTIAMANWTPQGFVGQMFKTVSTFIAPVGMPSPVLWGDETTVRERLSKGLSELNLTRRHSRSVIPFPRKWWSSSVSTTDQPIRPLHPLMPAAAIVLSGTEALWSLHNR